MELSEQNCPLTLYSLFIKNIARQWAHLSRIVHNIGLEQISLDNQSFTKKKKKKKKKKKQLQDGTGDSWQKHCSPVEIFFQTAIGVG